MGNSRRYDNLSHLIDTLDLYAEVGKGTRGKWSRLKPRRWHVDLKDRDHLYYVRATYTKDNIRYQNVRFFEAYWAPKMAGGLPALDVLKWFALQVPKAVIHLRAPWRSFVRTRISVLYQLVERGTIDRTAAQAMASLLDEFSHIERIRKYPQSTFKQFQKYSRAARLVPPFKKVKKNICPARPVPPFVASSPLEQPLAIWEKACRAENWKALLTSVGFIGLVVSVFVFSVTLAASVVSWSTAPFVDPIDFWRAEGLGRSVAQVMFGLLLASPLNGFLAEYFGDVAYWGTYDENDTKYEKRRAVLELCTETLEVIVQDPKCERVVIAAHSLGSRVTYESLLYMNYRRLQDNGNDETAAADELAKIKHLITYGSPIDKMHYFTESRSGFSRHYERTYNKLTGDASKLPFKKNGVPNILWVNFHTAGDAISGPIETPNDLEDFTPMIFNVPVVNYDNINMGKNHTGYFDNNAVVGWLHRVITETALDRDPLGNVEPQLPDTPEGVHEYGQRAARMYRGLLAYPVAVLAALGMGGLGVPALAGLAWAMSAALLGVMVWNIAGHAPRHANPFLPPPPETADAPQP
ncbi:hypothetical protein C8263_18025 [Deinococcus arcticus]|uniref:Alpha/beta hydrolase n=2 Tax=Deinococcus arcticus TaxID=2136176 RepID=A0A2T3W3E4_9DEIO|nr:hypothetical protein C8263_18025 [Deinococcus arcticus]